MRHNGPVTQHEFQIGEGQTLVSTTDLKSRIQYCNPSFIEVSGYEREELIGQPHNMIRHPDMPEEAFRDMWDTIARGKPWSAAVKNRRKDGTYYWVQANVTPLMQGDQPTGYMSVRTEPTREQVAEAEALYQRMREEKSSGRLVHVLREGRVLRNTWLGRLHLALQPGLSGKLTWVTAAVAGTAYGCGLWQGQHPDSSAPLYLGLPLMAVAVWGTRALVNRVALGPIQALIDTANRMAAGDLTQEIQTDRYDVVGQLTRSLNQLSVNLRSIVRDARTQSAAMVVGTAEIASGNLDLSQRTEAQASNLQQTAASMEEITGTVRQSAESARQASELSAQARAIAERGSEAVDEVSSNMRAIQDASKRISEIGASEPLTNR